MTDTPEPPIGSHVHQTDTVHTWTRLDNGAWSCACDVNDTVQWDWRSVMEDIGSAPFVVETAELAAQVERDHQWAVEAERTAEHFSVTREGLIAGIIVGVGGQHGPFVTQEQADRAADLIIREARRRAS